MTSPHVRCTCTGTCHPEREVLVDHVTPENARAYLAALRAATDHTPYSAAAAAEQRDMNSDEQRADRRARLAARDASERRIALLRFAFYTLGAKSCPTDTGKRHGPFLPDVRYRKWGYR